MFIVLAGLPGVGKSTFAAAIARRVDAVVLAVDEVEDALLGAGLPAGFTTGVAAYGVVERLAATQLGIGRSVVVDAVNDDPRARDQWHGLAARAGIPASWFELRLASGLDHRDRLEGRGRRYASLPEPAWSGLAARGAALAAWDGERVVLDASRSVEELVAQALGVLERR